MVEAGIGELARDLDVALGSGPQAKTCAGLDGDELVAAWKLTGLGSSASTFQLSRPKRNIEWAIARRLARRAPRRAGPRCTSRPVRPAPQAWTSFGLGVGGEDPVALLRRDRGAPAGRRRDHDGGGVSGRSNTRASSSLRCLPSYDR